MNSTDEQLVGILRYYEGEDYVTYTADIQLRLQKHLRAALNAVIGSAQQQQQQVESAAALRGAGAKCMQLALDAYLSETKK
jgi:hypothetical protein